MIYLSGYVAIAEFRTPALVGGARGNLKRISPVFIAALVTLRSVYI
jgi:hypothetical protein